MEFAILGPLELREAGRPLALGSFKQRTLLGLLLCHANRIVPIDALVDALWGDEPPRTARKNLQVYVSALRHLVGTAPDGEPRLVHVPPGYRLRLEPGQLDALRFEDFVRSGRRAAGEGDHRRAADTLGQAVALWRGAVLPELAQAPAIATAAERLDEQYLNALEDWFEVRLALGGHRQVAEDAAGPTAAHPTRERLRQAQMLALYRSGRPGEALARFDDLRQHLARDLGLQPSPVLSRLYRRILDGDPGLAPPATVLADDGARASAKVTVRRPALPRGPADFTGREREVERLSAALSVPGSVTTLTGSPGVGKTALALHCAHRRPEREAVLLAARTPEGRLRTVPDLLAELDHNTAGSGNPLVIIDDVATEAQVRPLLAAAGEAAVLVSGLRHLGGLGATAHLSLLPLVVTDSLALLTRIVGAHRVGAEPGAARRLVTACAGLPLLIRMVGTKLRALRHLTLSRLADRLADESQLLDELVIGDHDVAYRLGRWLADVPPRDLRVLDRLATVPSGVVSADIETERALERLAEAHLVTVRPPLYGVPRLVRALLGQRAAAT